MSTSQVKSFNAPDETRTPPKASMEIVNFGDMSIVRMTCEPGWGEMREADMKCKVAARLLLLSPDHFLLQAPSHLPFSHFPATLTRSRKLAAEGTFCRELNQEEEAEKNQFTLKHSLLSWSLFLPTGK